MINGPRPWIGNGYIHATSEGSAQNFEDLNAPIKLALIHNGPPE